MRTASTTPLPLGFPLALPLALGVLLLAACDRSAPPTPAANPATADAAASPPRDSAVDANPAHPDTETAPAPESPAAPAAPAAARGFAPLPPGSPLGYGCEDGSEVRIRWGRDEATVALSDGRAVRLPKAQSASKGGGEVFVGEAMSLMRDGLRVELHADGAPARVCRQHQT